LTDRREWLDPCDDGRELRVRDGSPKGEDPRSGASAQPTAAALDRRTRQHITGVSHGAGIQRNFGTNALTRPIHDWMPVILDTRDFSPWLNGAAGAELLRPAADDRLRMWPVSRRINKTGIGDDDLTLIEEVAA
jgi:hypothetical protein